VAKAKKATQEGVIELRRLEEKWIEVPIKGVTPFIPHKWSEKSKRMMPGHPERDSVKTKKEVRKPEEEAEACVYRMEDGSPGFPATGFKGAMVGACRFFEKPTMVEAKQLIFVQGEGLEQLVAIQGEPVLREDTVRNASGTADLRYRYAFTDWSATLRIRFVPNLISASSIIALVDAAGRGGVGDWRPSAPKSYTGTFGTWRVDEEKEIVHG